MLHSTGDTQAGIGDMQGASVSDTLYRMGRGYEKGVGVDTDMGKAVYYYQRAAVQGNRDALYQLARCHEYGWGTPPDRQKAFQCYKKAAELGDVDAQYMIDMDEIRQASNMGGGADALFALALCYEHVFLQVEKALPYYLFAAEQGCHEARYRLALCYEQGKGVPADQEKADALFQEAFEKGKGGRELFCDTLLCIAMSAEKGWNTHSAVDRDRAIRFYKMAGERGDTYAMSRLLLLGEGLDGALTEEERQALLQKEGMRDKGYALFRLGLCYEEGKSVPQDLRKANLYYQLAADNGDRNGMARLAWCCEQGVGVEKDRAKASHYYQLAADEKEGYASLRMAFRYEYGIGVPVDKEKANRYHRSAHQSNSSLIMDELLIIHRKEGS